MMSRLSIVGGGLAGLAAAVEAVNRGLRVELFERTPFLGGRAGSLVDSRTGQLIDYCPHVAMGCCSQFLDFCQRTGLIDCFQATNALHFIAPDGRQCDVSSIRWLPPPFHLLPGLMRLRYLSLGERWSIIRALHSLTREVKSPSDDRAAEERTIGQWLRRKRQSQRAIDAFWSVIIDSALAETAEYASLDAARQLFRDGFMASRDASELWLSRFPLREIFHRRILQWFTDHGVRVHLGAAALSIEGDSKRAQSLLLRDGSRRPVERIVVAVPWHRLQSILSPNLVAAAPTIAGVGQIEPAAIAAVHLWFDRPVVPLPHAVLVGRLAQWVFVGSDRQTLPSLDDAARQHCQVVISGTHRLTHRTRDQWLREIRDDLQAVWPEAANARLLHSRVVQWPAAAFSMRPRIDWLRPPQRTAIANLALAGDWTATGWPATMESAVRSGYRAVESLLD